MLRNKAMKGRAQDEVWLRRPTKQGVTDCTAPALEQVEGSNPSVRVSRRRVEVSYLDYIFTGH